MMLEIRNSFLFFSPLLLLFSCFGCAHRPPPPLNGELFLERSHQQFLDSRSPFQANGRLRVTAPDLYQTLDLSLCWESTRRFRVDIIGPLGMRLASAALTDSLAWLWAPLAGVELRGRADRLDSLSLERLGLAIQDMMDFIQGWPMPPQDRPTKAWPKKGSIVYNFSRSDTIITLEIDRNHGMPQSIRVRHGGNTLWEASFDEQQSFGPGFRPRRLFFRAPALEISLELELNLSRRPRPFPAETWSPPEKPSSE
jgi:outer membrane biogenesis lipoprotein LolB